jgi:hypothetical protein
MTLVTILRRCNRKFCKRGKWNLLYRSSILGQGRALRPRFTGVFGGEKKSPDFIFSVPVSSCSHPYDFRFRY